MWLELPAFYHRLRPFAAAFAHGVPMLMYHKLGPRPPQVRLKGLYLSARLFERQLNELSAAGFVGVAPSSALVAGSGRRIVLSFDDGYQNLLRYGLPLLERYRFSAIVYLVAARLGGHNDWDIAEGEAPETLMDAAQVREWLAAGQRIGSHGLTHARLTRLTPAAAREEMMASRKRLEDLFGVEVADFCYPYGDWDRAVADGVIAAGYRTACTTGFGLNTPATDPFAMKRIMARYRSWSPWALRRRQRFPVEDRVCTALQPPLE
ncbi:MAG: polysaccharide deacetylase family protein [Gammaproteobacteria bacterium]|nr:polysaccharide deacetylase family protein [Gammaproteobacteria bacterium]